MPTSSSWMWLYIVSIRARSICFALRIFIIKYTPSAAPWFSAPSFHKISPPRYFPPRHWALLHSSLNALPPLLHAQQLLSDVLSSGTCIDTQIIDKKRGKRHHIVWKWLLLQLTECIAETVVILICCNINRFGIILYHLCKFFVCVFCGSRDKISGRISAWTWSTCSSSSISLGISFSFALRMFICFFSFCLRFKLFALV